MERKFEICKGYEELEIELPKRETTNAAGYDFKAASDVIVLAGSTIPTLVKTGVKAQMPEKEVLLLANRSSNTIKRNLILANGIGVIDSDYYENEDNDGDIIFAFLNNGNEDVHIKKGERIGQGVFLKFETVLEYTKNQVKKRTGGLGSTN